MWCGGEVCAHPKAGTRRTLYAARGQGGRKAQSQRTTKPSSLPDPLDLTPNPASHNLLSLSSHTPAALPTGPGTIPDCIGSNLTGLVHLHLNTNDLHGPIPSSLCRIGDTLTNLVLSDNGLTGECVGWDVVCVLVKRCATPCAPGVSPGTRHTRCLISHGS